MSSAFSAFVSLVLPQGDMHTIPHLSLSPMPRDLSDGLLSSAPSSPTVVGHSASPEDLDLLLLGKQLHHEILDSTPDSSQDLQLSKRLCILAETRLAQSQLDEQESEQVSQRGRGQGSCTHAQGEGRGGVPGQGGGRSTPCPQGADCVWVSPVTGGVSAAATIAEIQQELMRDDNMEDPEGDDANVTLIQGLTPASPQPPPPITDMVQSSPTTNAAPDAALWPASQSILHLINQCDKPDHMAVLNDFLSMMAYLNLALYVDENRQVTGRGNSGITNLAKDCGSCVY
ncbi:hypothetical protein C8J57DRAFT_1243273 [Mycena rebaudengoi]|nr:hypothetical protein C8J57DRAFT_1243273 [Mycena rebaudengoi]